MKKKPSVAKSKTPKVRRAKRVETANEIDVLDLIDSLLSDDLCMELEMEIYRDDGKLSPLEKSCAEKIGLLYRVAHGFNKSNRCYRVHEAWREEGRQLAKSLCEWQAAPKPLLAPPKDDVAGVQPATPEPAPAAPPAVKDELVTCDRPKCELPKGHLGFHRWNLGSFTAYGTEAARMGQLPSTPNPSPAKITPPTPAPIPPRCPHGLARGFWAMGETKPCKRTDQHIHHVTAGGVIWNDGARWGRILKDGVWTRP